MNSFTYIRADDVADAVRADCRGPGRQVHRRRHESHRPDEGERRAAEPADRYHPPAAEESIEDCRSGGLRIGALRDATPILPTMQQVEQRYPLLSSAILAGASPQLRNMATAGGNLLQRTRCCYFYDTATPCNKRAPGQRLLRDRRVQPHARDPGHERCTASPRIRRTCAWRWPPWRRSCTSPDRVGERTIPFAEFHRLPGDTPQRRHEPRPDEIITAVDLPPKGFAGTPAYLKVRDRASYAFALVSAAAGLELDGETIRRRASPSAAWRTSRGAICRLKRSCTGNRPMPQHSPARRTCCCAMPEATSTTPSRSISRAVASCARSRKRPRQPQSQSSKKIA